MAFFNKTRAFTPEKYPCARESRNPTKDKSQKIKGVTSHQITDYLSWKIALPRGKPKVYQEKIRWKTDSVPPTCRLPKEEKMMVENGVQTETRALNTPANEPRARESRVPTTADESQKQTRIIRRKRWKLATLKKRVETPM